MRRAKPKDGPSRRARAVSASRRWTLFLAVAVLALVVRLIYVTQIAHAPFADLRIGDAKAYHQWALRIAAGDWLGRDVFYQAPLYPYFLAGLYTTLGDGASMVRFVQAALGAGSCALLAAAGIALFGEWGAAAGVLLAIYPPAIFLDGLLEKSALVTFFVTALLYLVSARYVRGRWFLAGLSLGCLALTRENALLLIVPVLAWAVIGNGSEYPEDVSAPRRWAWPAAAFFLGGCLLVLLPVAARNHAVGGEFHLTTSQFGPNFYIGNHAGARGLYEPLVPGHGDAADEREDATRLAEDASRRTLTPDEVSGFWTGRAVAFIRSQPGAWLGQLARKLALTFNAVEIADTESQEVYAEWSPLLRVLEPFGFGVLFGLAVFGACITATAWRRLWGLYAIVFVYTLSIVAFYVFARYRFPLVPVLILLAAGGIAAVREPTARPKWRWAFAAAVLAAGLAYLPLEQTRADRIAHYVNIGNALLAESGRRDEAVAFYDKALKESPQSPAAHLGLATLLTERRQPQEAVTHYRTAAEGWPDNADVRLNFAIALVDAGDDPGALEQLSAAARLRPRDPTPHLVEGALMLERSRPGEALQAYERALALDPGNLAARDGVARAQSMRRR